MLSPTIDQPLPSTEIPSMFNVFFRDIQSQHSDKRAIWQTAAESVVRERRHLPDHIWARPNRSHLTQKRIFSPPPLKVALLQNRQLYYDDIGYIVLLHGRVNRPIPSLANVSHWYWHSSSSSVIVLCEDLPQKRIFHNTCFWNASLRATPTLFCCYVCFNCNILLLKITVIIIASMLMYFSFAYGKKPIRLRL